MAMCIFISTRLIQETFRLLWYDYVLAGALSAVAVWNMLAHFDRGVFRLDIDPHPHLRLEVGIGALLLASAIRFYRQARYRDSIGFRLLSLALMLWAVLLGYRQFHYRFEEMFGRFGHFLGPVPQMLLGIGMLMVLF